MTAYLPMYEGPVPTGTDLISAQNGSWLFTQHWLPDDDPRAIVVIVHGYAEHSDRYRELAGHFVEAGYGVYTYDQRGFGRSEGRRAYIHAFDDLLDDLGLFVLHVRERWADRPLFLFGHSMGGAVSLLFALDRPHHGLNGLILSSPAIAIKEDFAPLLQKAAYWIGRIVPMLPTVRLPDNSLSRDPSVEARVDADPLYYHGGIRARTGAELVQASKRAQAEMHRLDVPLLLLHGTADQITEPDASRMLYSEAVTDDKTLNLYDGFYHETFNEPEKEQVIRDIVDWLDARA